MDKLSTELNKLRIEKTQRSNLPRSGKPVLIISVLLIALLAGAGVFMFPRTSAGIPVQVVRPRVESGESAVLIATGYVVAHHKIELSSKIIGKVAWIGVEKGDKVKTGQVLVRLEDREYRAQADQARGAYEAAKARLAELERGSRPEEIERARAEMERAEAQLRTEAAQFRRVEGLVKEGVFPPQSLDEARGRYDTARANLAALTKAYELVRLGPRQEQIEQARAEVNRAQAQVQYAETLLEAAEIRAPIAGTILERIVEPGEMVTTSFVGERGAKSSVVALADLKDLQVELDINQNDFSRIRLNHPCTAVTDAYPDHIYKCHVAEIAPEGDRQKATVQVKVKILDPDELIRPEMNATVTFLGEKPKSGLRDSKVFVVPARAVVDRDNRKAVLVVIDGAVQVRPIQVERQVGSDVFVAQGLSGNEAIIVGGQLGTLKPGDRVDARQE